MDKDFDVVMMQHPQSKNGRKRGPMLTVFGAIVFFLVLFPRFNFAAPMFSIEPIGPTGNPNIKVTAINDRGHLVGWIETTPGGALEAFVWDENNAVDPLTMLGTLSGEDRSSSATDVSNASVLLGEDEIVVVGWSETASQGVQAFRWEGGTMTMLPSLAGEQGRANGIDDGGLYVAGASGVTTGGFDVTGTAVFWCPELYCFSQEPFTLPDLDTSRDVISAAYSVNSLGRIVGYSFDANSRRKATLWEWDQTPRSLGALGGSAAWSLALDINNVPRPVETSTETIVGFSHPSGSIRNKAFSSRFYRMTEIGGASAFYNSGATKLNDSGEIIGNGFPAGSTFPVPVYFEGDQAIDLNTLVDAPGWELGAVADINEHGVIVGNGVFNGVPRAYKLVPIAVAKTVSTPVEPNDTDDFYTSLPPNQTEATFSTSWPGSTVEMTLTSPSGRVIDASTTGADITRTSSPTTETYTLTTPEPGRWQVSLFGADLPDGTEDVAFALTTEASDTQPNRRPYAFAGEDIEVECAKQGGALVILDGGQSGDSDEDPLNFSWSTPSTQFHYPYTSTPKALFPYGSSEATLVVDDGELSSAPDTVFVDVVDTQAPSLEVYAQRIYWQHTLQHYKSSELGSGYSEYDYVPVKIKLQAEDICSAALEVTATVYRENVIAPLSDGSQTPADIKVTRADGTVLLSSNENPAVEFDPRYEWLDIRKDHVYRLNITATDEAGNQVQVSMDI